MTSVAAPRSQVGSINGLRLVTVALALVPVFTLGIESETPQATRVLASILWVLCLVPAWHYLHLPEERRPPIPFMPLIGGAYLFYYPLRPVLGQSPVNYLFRIDAGIDYGPAVQYALVGWVAVLVGYFGASSFRLNTPFRSIRPTDPATLRRWGMLLMWGGLAIDLGRQSIPIPVVLRGLLSFTTMFVLLGIALVMILAVQGRLTSRDRWLLFAGIVMTALFRGGSGMISNTIVLALTILVAVWAGGGRLGIRWLLIGVLSATLTIAMRGVTMEYRIRSWFGETQLSPVDRALLMADLLASKAKERGVAATVEDGWEIIAVRCANLDLLADIVRHTGSTVPFWGGETYLSLVGFAVPRFLWPGKPTKTLGQDFGHRYGYLDIQDTWTSINLPFLVEFYANFGEVGVLIGMLIVGLLYRLLDNDLNRPRQPLQVTICGLALLVPMLNIESDFSLVFGGLFMNGVALWGLLLALDRLPRWMARRRSGLRASAVALDNAVGGR